MASRKYPYQDLSLVTIKGERWKDIPGLEGYFKVSNLGRIKRMAYEAIYKNGAIYPESEMIMKPYVRWQINNYKKDYTPFLVIRVAMENVRYNYTISRLVYNCFVKTIDLKDPSIVIFYKDGDNFNLKASNLYLATISEKQKRIKLLKRSPSPLHKMTPEERRIRQALIAKLLSKQVSQYNLMTGKKIKTFSSAKEAYRATGISDCSIGTVARGIYITAGGFLWRYGKAPEIDIRPLIKMRTIKHSPAGKRLLELNQQKKGTIKKHPTVKVNTEKAYNVHTKHRMLQKASKRKA